MSPLQIIGGLFVGIIGVYIFLYSAARRRVTRDWALQQQVLPAVADIMPTFSGLTNGDIYADSNVEIFLNGSIFAAMLADIDAATRTIHFETYLWNKGKLEKSVSSAMIDAVNRGVVVRMVVDGFGSYRRSKDVFDEMQAAGVQLHFFSPLQASSLHRFNERTHRKLLVVDGKIGYTGGHGIGDLWLGDGRDKDEVRDTGVRLTGPVVHGLQSVFASGWASETNELLVGADVFPTISAAGTAKVCVVSSAAGEAYSNVGVAYALAIAAAREQILIQNPYFAPDLSMLGLLCDAAHRGVSVRLMLPGSRTDSVLLRLAARHLYPRLLDAGVEIYEYQPSLSHQKVMVVDELFARVGSTNLDCRSLELNAEAGIASVDRQLAAELSSQFAQDMTYCERVSTSDLKKLSWGSRTAAAGLYFLRSQL